MKTLTTIILLLLAMTSQAQFITLNQDEELFISGWVDPTFTDAGAQFGIEITKELEGGWVSAGISHYAALDPTYTDIVASGGINLHFFNYDAVKYYAGGRIGYVNREEYSPHALIGAVWGFDYKLSSLFNMREDIRIGLRYYIDWRTDQADQFLGDSDAFVPGPLGIKNSEKPHISCVFGPLIVVSAYYIPLHSAHEALSSGN